MGSFLLTMLSHNLLLVSFNDMYVNMHRQRILRRRCALAAARCLLQPRLGVAPTSSLIRAVFCPARLWRNDALDSKSQTVTQIPHIQDTRASWRLLSVLFCGRVRVNYW